MLEKFLFKNEENDSLRDLREELGLPDSETGDIMQPPGIPRRRGRPLGGKNSPAPPPPVKAVPDALTEVSPTETEIADEKQVSEMQPQLDKLKDEWGNLSPYERALAIEDILPDSFRSSDLVLNNIARNLKCSRNAILSYLYVLWIQKELLTLFKRGALSKESAFEVQDILDDPKEEDVEIDESKLFKLLRKSKAKITPGLVKRLLKRYPIDDKKERWFESLTYCRIKPGHKGEGSILKGKKLLYVPLDFLDTDDGLKLIAEKFELSDIEKTLLPSLVEKWKKLVSPSHYVRIDENVLVLVRMESGLYHSKVPMSAIEPIDPRMRQAEKPMPQLSAKEFIHGVSCLRAGLEKILELSPIQAMSNLSKLKKSLDSIFQSIDDVRKKVDRALELLESEVAEVDPPRKCKNPEAAQSLTSGIAFFRKGFAALFENSDNEILPLLQNQIITPGALKSRLLSIQEMLKELYARLTKELAN